jgi:trans-aconitate 2-methyltransferase
MTVQWDPVRYGVYADERSRPFLDLVARIEAHDVRSVVDLGCGPGVLTLLLAERWPAAEVTGVDSSPEMVATAAALDAPAGRVTFLEGDLRSWRPAEPVEVLVSNAALQWVPEHLDLLEDLVARVTPGGWLAFQVPGNFGEPSHALMRELRDSPRWGERLAHLRAGQPVSHDPSVYLERLIALGCTADVWETTYLHVLQGPDPVLEWVSGTGLRPILGALDDDEREEFLAAYGPALRAAYPARPYGTVLPFRRIFAVARTPA